MNLSDIATGRLALVVPVTAQSTLSLRNRVAHYKGRDRSLTSLYNVLEDLCNSLISLEQTTISEASMETILEGPIRRCNLLCQEFENAMQEFGMKPTAGLRDWSTMEFTTGDINEFIDILTGYQATISVCLETVTKQTIKLSHKALEGFEEKIQRAVYTLNMNLQRVDEKMDLNSRESRNTSASARKIELKKEWVMINRCLRICQDVSSHVRPLEAQEGPLENRHPSASFPDSQSLLEAQTLRDKTSTERQWLQQRAAHRPSRGTFIDTQSPSSRRHCADGALEHVDAELGAKSKPSAILSHIPPTSSRSANSAQPATSLSPEASADRTDEIVGALASRRVTPEDFENAAEYCIFRLFSPENFSSIEWPACNNRKEEMSHIITHIIDYHGLIRGKDPRNASRKYLASCQTSNPFVKAKGICVKCSSIYKWNDKDFADSAHDGIVLCMRCWYPFNKKEMQDHLAGPLCPYNAEKPKQKKSCDLYKAFCSETQPPSKPPSRSHREKKQRRIPRRQIVDPVSPSPPRPFPVPQTILPKATSSSDQQSFSSRSGSSPSLRLSTSRELSELSPWPDFDKPSDPSLRFTLGGDLTTASLTTYDILNSGEDQKCTSSQVATSDTLIEYAEEAVELEADKGNATGHGGEEPDKVNVKMDDVALVQSLDGDIQSNSSSHARASRAIASERQVGTLLARHPDVRFVLEQSIGIMPKDTLKRNIRRSLKLYLHDSEETQSNDQLQILATRMFKRCKSRARISRRIVEEAWVGVATNPGYEDVERSAFHKDQAFLGTLLLNLQSAEQTDERLRDSYSSKDEESESSTSSPPSVSEQDQAVQFAEDFLIRSAAFRAFLTNLALLLLPVYLRQVMQLATWSDIGLIGTAFNISISTSDRIKSSVENLTGSPWNWWPLAPPKIPLRRGHVRMNWKCHCGKASWVDITPSQARIIERMINNPTSFVENKENTHSRQSVVQSIASWFRRRSESLLPTSTPASQNNHLPSSGIENSDQAQGVTAFAEEGDNLPSTNCDLRILFGVPTGPKTLHLTPILVTQQPKSEVFPQMQKEHKRIRGRTRAWFSFWQLSHCNFVKFESIARNVVVACGQGLPEANDIDYDFSPKPASLPPIHPHVFEAAFNSCAGGSCRRLFPPHECYEFEETIYVPRIPKKKTPLNSGKGNAAIWGLEARYCISCFHVILYHVLILIPPFALWGVWMTKHPGDIQSASVPMTVVVAMISMFWSATGILKQFRGEL